MATAFAGGRIAASTFIIGIFTAGLRLSQLCFDLEFNGAGEMVLENFLLMDKSVTCLKLFFSAYRQVHAEGVGMFAFSCLFGLSIHLFTIVIHLYKGHTSLARAWISGMAFLAAAGAFLLGMKIPEDYACHNTAVEAILICFACLEAFLLVRNKMSEHGGNENFLRDLLMILADTLVAVYLLVDYLGRTRSPWGIEKILHLVGSCLSVLIGLGHMVWIIYKAYINGVLAGAEEQDSGAATDGGDVEQQSADKCAEVVGEGDSKTARLVFSVVALAPPVFTRKLETTVIENDAGGEEEEEVLPDEVGVEVVVPSPG